MRGAVPPVPPPLHEPDVTKSPKPPRDADAPGTEVIEHMRRLEARAAPGLMAHVIPIFVRDTSSRLGLLRTAVAKQDIDTAYRVAHTLHGSAATVGADSMVRNCAEIIRQVRVGEFDRCESAIKELDDDLDSIRRVSEALGI